MTFVLENGWNGNICSMIDARRMEVYSCISNGTKILKQTSPDVLDENSYSNLDLLTVVGDGALKMKEIWANRKAVYFDNCPLNTGV